MSCLLLSCSKTEAKLGLSQINKLRGIVDKRKKIAEFYNKELQHLSNKIAIPPIVDGASYSKYTIRVDNRNEFIKNMYKLGVEVTAVFRYSLPHMPEFSKYADESFENCSKASTSIVNLPNCPHLLDNKEKLSYVVNAVEKCLE